MFFTLVIPFCLLFQNFLVSSQQQLVIDYVAKVIGSITNNQRGIFNCWFYNLEDSNPDFISDLLNDLALQTMPKLIMTSTNLSAVNPFEHNPSLIVMRCVICIQQSWKHFTHYRVSVETKILVLHECTTSAQFAAMYSVFRQLKLANTVFLDLNTNSMFYVLLYKQELVEVQDFKVDPSELFVNQVGNLYWYFVAVSVNEAKPETTVFGEHGLWGRDFAWIGDTADHLNGSVGFAKIYCEEERLSFEECERKKKFRRNKEPFDINLDSSFDIRMKAYFIDSVEPDRWVIMVPCGQKLTTLEVFIVPFQWNVWILLIVLIISCWVLVLNYSTVFINDPILAALSGIERRSIHRTSKPEKFLVLVLTILFFILLQVYETKIIALMTSYPYKSDPRNLDDLRRLGIKLRYIEGGSKYFIGHSDLQDLVEIVADFGAESEMLRYASIGEENLVNLLATMPNYFYASVDRPRFVILKDYSLGLAIRQYWMSQRNLLNRVFKKTQRIFFEAGIRKLKIDHVMHIHRLKSQLITNSASSFNFAEDDDVLDFEEILPAWYVASIGWMFSGIVCVVEIALKKINILFKKSYS